MSLSRLLIHTLPLAEMYPFFIHLARELERYGQQVYFLPLWPSHAEILRNNGLGGRILDWRTTALRRVRISDRFMEEALRTDTVYCKLKGARRKTFRRNAVIFARSYLPALSELARKNDISGILLWNGYPFIHRLAVKVARNLDLPTFYMENGFFPNTVQLDHAGINASNSLRQRTLEEWDRLASELNSNDPDVREFLSTLHSPPRDESDLPACRSSESGWELREVAAMATHPQTFFNIPGRSPARNSFSDWRISRRAVSESNAPDLPLPKRYVFLPFQVHDDTQIVVHSPWIKDMQQLVREVCAAVKRVDNTLDLVCKEHPMDVGRVDYSELGRLPGVSVRATGNLQEMLRNAATVITVNSTVGVEALVEEKPVITLGRAVYSVSGLADHAWDRESLANSLRRSLEERPNLELLRRRLAVLRFHDCVTGTWRQPHSQTVAEIAARIRTRLKKE